MEKTNFTYLENNGWNAVLKLCIIIAFTSTVGSMYLLAFVAFGQNGLFFSYALFLFGFPLFKHSSLYLIRNLGFFNSLLFLKINTQIFSSPICILFVLIASLG